MSSVTPKRVAVLILPGGKPSSTVASRAWQLANVRMAAFAVALQRHLGAGAGISLVRYRRRGWNQNTLDALHDAERALDDLRAQWPGLPVVLVGHSMGGRVAAHLSQRDGVAAVAALAPWWPRDDAALIPSDRHLLVLHGTSDTWTDPVSSRTQTERARQRGMDASWVGLAGAGHYMLSGTARWHRLTAEFIAAQRADTS